MRKVVALVIAGVVVVVVAYIALRRPAQQNSGGAGSASSGGGAATRAPEGPSLGGAADPSKPEVQAKFQERKTKAMVRLHEQVERSLAACAPRGDGSAAPRPRMVSLRLRWDPTLSTPELQRYVVEGARVVETAEPVSPESLKCLDKLAGLTLDVLLPKAELPTTANEVDEPLPLPLR